MRFANRAIHYFFFQFVVKGFMFLLIGLNIRHREWLPVNGPAIIVANHNSHLDTLGLLSLFEYKTIKKIRPVAAADYWLGKKFISWLALDICRIIPVRRGARDRGEDPLRECHEALARGEILILYPEGSRGEAGKLARFKSGIWHLAKEHPEVPVIPVFLSGFSRVMPKGQKIILPLFCDVFVGSAIRHPGEKNEYVEKLAESIVNLAKEGNFCSWFNN